MKDDIKFHEKKVALFTKINITDVINEICPITNRKMGDCKSITITPCGKCYDSDGIDLLFGGNHKSIKCPLTRDVLIRSDLIIVDPTEKKDTIIDINVNKWGTKMAHMIKVLTNIINEDPSHKIIIFSQWDNMLKLVNIVLQENNIKAVFCKGSVHMMSKSITDFKNNILIKIILLSSETCSSGTNLTEASHIIFLDTINTPALEEQAIARAVRLGQTRRVKVIKFVTKNTIEEKLSNMKNN